MLLAVRVIDLAIFATMGSLWLGGAVFIYFVWRWVIRYERQTEGPSVESDMAQPRPHTVPKVRPRPSRVLPIGKGLTPSSNV